MIVNMQILSIFLLALVLPVDAAEIKISKLRSGDGYVAVSVFPESGRDAFPGEAKGAEKSMYVKLSGSTEVTLQLKDLPKGRYAIAVLHDEDGDRKLDSLLGMPAEGFGFSNNPTVYFGPPGFDKAAVEIDDSAELNIAMKYLL